MLLSLRDKATGKISLIGTNLNSEGGLLSAEATLVLLSGEVIEEIQWQPMGREEAKKYFLYPESDVFIALRSNRRILLFTKQLRIISEVHFEDSQPDLVLSISWVGSCLCFSRASGRVEYILPESLARDKHYEFANTNRNSKRESILLQRRRAQIVDRNLGFRYSSSPNSSIATVGHLCSLPNVHLSRLSCTPMCIVGVLPDRLLLSFLSYQPSRNYQWLPTLQVSARPCNPLEMLLRQSGLKKWHGEEVECIDRGREIEKLCLPYLCPTPSQLDQTPLGQNFTLNSSQRSAALLREISNPSFRSDLLAFLIANCVDLKVLSPTSEFFVQHGWIAQTVRSILLSSKDLPHSSLWQRWSRRLDIIDLFQADEGSGGSSLPHRASITAHQLAAAGGCYMRSNDSGYGRRLLDLAGIVYPDSKSSDIQHLSHILKLQSFGRSDRPKSLTSAPISITDGEGDSSQLQRYRNLQQQLLQSFLRRGGGVGPQVSLHVLALDLLEDFMGLDLVLETRHNPNGGDDNVQDAHDPMQQTGSEPSFSVSSSWVPEIGEGREVDKLVVRELQPIKITINI